MKLIYNPGGDNIDAKSEGDLGVPNNEPKRIDLPEEARSGGGMVRTGKAGTVSGGGVNQGRLGFLFKI